MSIVVKILCFILLVFPFCVKSQNVVGRHHDAVEKVMTYLANQLGEDADYSVFSDDLDFFAQNPINLNEVNEEQLEQLHFLPDYIVQGILDYKNEFGQIYSPYELIAAKGMDEELIRILIPFVNVNPVFVKKSRSTYMKQQLIGKIQRSYPESKGYQSKNDSLPSPYSGGPYKSYLKYSMAMGDFLSVGFSAEKDPGEDFFKRDNRYGFDFYSGYVAFSGQKCLKKLVVGDYHLRLGQGLILWTGMGRSKSAEVVTVRNTGQGTRRYTSVDENRFLRGVSSEFRFGPIDLQLFYSNHKVDGTLKTNENEEIVVSALQTSGMHRTVSEVNNEKSVQEEIKGGAIRFRNKNFKIGINGTYQGFDPAISEKERLYQKFNFYGQENYNLSIDHHFRLGKTSFFGEYAICRSGGKAFLQGVEAQLMSQFRMVAVYRNYQKNFHATLADPFAESHGYNELGWYFGAVILPFSKIKLSMYFDFFEHPWLTYSSASPTRGEDFLGQLDYQISKKSKFSFRVKKERKDTKLKDMSGISPDVSKDKINVRFHFSSDVSENFSVRTRIEQVKIEHNLLEERGWLVFQDISLHPVRVPLTFTLRFALFDTDSYNSRIYVYENDLLYNFSIPSFFGKGTRYYANLRYSPTRNLDLWLKAACTKFSDQSVIGSGNDQVESDWKGEIKLQARIKF